MSEVYSYENERPYVFTDEGQRQLIQMRDWVLLKLSTAGAFTAGKALGVVSTPDTYKAWALLDRLVELGVVVEVPGQTGLSQYLVYTSRRSP